MIYLELFWEFFKIGAFTFGGGYAAIPLIQQAVTGHNWMTLEELINFIAVSESTPGAFAINISTYIGSETAGLLGSLIAVLAVVIPCYVCIVIVAKVYNRFNESYIVKGLMFGLKSTVVGLIAATVLSVGKEVFFPGAFTLDVFKSPAIYVSLFILALSLYLLFRRKINPIFIIFISAAMGIVAGYCGLIPIQV